MKKRLLSLALALVLGLGLITPALATEPSFVDVPEKYWGYADITAAAEKGYMVGVSADHFDPEGTVNVAQFLTLLGRMVFPEVTTEGSTWYGPYAEKAQASGFLNGTQVDVNDVWAGISRYDMAVILRAAAKELGISEKMAAQADVNDYGMIPTMYAEAVLAVYGMGLITGDNKHNFNGSATMRRAEVAVVIMRLDRAIHTGIDTSTTQSTESEAPSRKILTGQQGELDQTDLALGTVAVRYTGKVGIKLKVQITQPNGSDYNYDLNSAGDWETFPLTLGDGTYTVKLMKHKEATRYTMADSWSLTIALEDPMAPFLRPNQIVNYSEGPVLTLAENLTASQISDARKVATLFDYVVDHVEYDGEKILLVQSGYLPNVEDTLASGKGICFDYAALLCAMIRSQGIPCRLVTGYVGGEKIYHAWVEVYCRDSDTVDGVIPITANTWSRLDPTLVSTGNRSSSILALVTNNENYEPQFYY